MKSNRIFGDTDRQTVINDLSIAEPGDALSERYARGCWRVIPYAVGEVQGKLLYANYDAQARPVEIPLPVTGWHAVWLGFFTPCWTYEVRLKLRLDTNGRYIRCAPPPNSGPLDIHELFWKYVHIGENDTLGLAQFHEGQWNAGLASIRLAPLSAEEIAIVEKQRAEKQNCRLIALNDQFSDMYSYGAQSAGDIETSIEPYRETHFKRIMWELGSPGKVNYRSRHTAMLGDNVSMFPRDGDRRAAESLKRLDSKGVNPLQVACDYAHEIGLEFYVSQRIASSPCAPPNDEAFGSSEFDSHPEWRCRNKDGGMIGRLSFCYPEVRRMAIELFREAASVGADGLNILYVRGYPYVLYEESVVEGFKDEHGVDPRDLPRDEPRWLAWHAGIMTGFMRELREASRGWGGVVPKISVVVHASEKKNMRWGLDLRTWVREGLVDVVISHFVPNTESDVLDTDFFAGICKDSDVEWYFDMLLRNMKPHPGDAGYLRLARQAYDAGADGLAFWDTNGIDPDLKTWNVIRKLGDPANMADDDCSETGVNKQLITEFDGVVEYRYPTHWCY